MAPDPARTRGTVTCPDCGRRVPSDQPLCECGFPLEFLEDREPPRASRSTTRRPGEADDDTTVDDADATPVDAPQASDTQVLRPLPAAGPTCPSCGTENERERTWCVRCGTRLRGQDAPPPPPPPPPPRRRSMTPVLVGVTVLVLVAAAAAFAVVTLFGGDGGGPGQEDPPGTAAPVPRERIVRAEASSIQQPDGDVTYGPELTLDGNPATAWNHDGNVDADPPGIPPEGVRLRYTFDGPLHVTALQVLNGYVKTGPTGEDLFAANHRVAGARISGDSGSVEVTFADTRDPQVVDADLGPTSTVTIEVLSVYQGARYDDVAISEMGFLALP
ncbi:zinc finger Ran-binding domain-containing protein [Thalassiella azotivora]